MQNLSISIFKRFTNFKYLNLNNAQNCKLDDLAFLRNNEQLLKIEILKNKIPVTQINPLLKCKCVKNIALDVIDSEEKAMKGCFLEITNKDNPIFSVLAQDLETVSKQVNLYHMGTIRLRLNCAVEHASYIKLLKKLKKPISVSVNDFSCLPVEQAQKMKDTLNLTNLKVLENGKSVPYDIDDYIQTRRKIDQIIGSIEMQMSEAEKFLKIYKILGNELKNSENYDRKQMAQILQNCLQCVNIKSNIIIGEELENEKEHAWNQVKLEGKWYHVDLGLDLENIKKKKAEYCLLGDKNFLETHTPKAGKNHYCAEDFNPKLIHVFFKTGLFHEKLVESYFQVLIEKIKKLLHFNKRKEILSLQEGKVQDKEI